MPLFSFGPDRKFRDQCATLHDLLKQTLVGSGEIYIRSCAEDGKCFASRDAGSPVCISVYPRRSSADHRSAGRCAVFSDLKSYPSPIGTCFSCAYHPGAPDWKPSLLSPPVQDKGRVLEVFQSHRVIFVFYADSPYAKSHAFFNFILRPSLFDP